AVKLYLENPVVPGGHILHKRCKLRLVKLRWHSAPCGGVLLPARGFLRDAVPASGCRAFLDLCKIAFRRHAGCVTFGQRTPFFGMGILLFDEKPVFTLFVLLVPHSNKNPFALHALAFKREFEVAALQPFMWITLRCPYALVPEKHRACTVILFRYRAFESRVIHRMI